jgi:pimeloyl-ACP methyl ester carboxylesterase
MNSVMTHDDTSGTLSSKPTRDGGRYVDVDDMRMYFERHGSGQPLVLVQPLSGQAWDPVRTLLAARYDVINPDMRGQGRTSEGDGPISYGRMASDLVRLLDLLQISAAHFVGWSDGGCDVLHMLVDFPDRVRSATLIGTPLHHDDYVPYGVDYLRRMFGELRGGEDPQNMRLSYEELSPHPGRWLSLLGKLERTWLSQPMWADQVLATVERPVLVIEVEHDAFLPVQVFRRTAKLFPRGQLASIPEGTHGVVGQFPEELAQAIIQFIDSLPAESTRSSEGS